MLEATSLAILIGAGLVVISVFTSLISYRVGAPLLLVFLGVGLAAGEDGIGGIQFDNAELAYFVGSVALAIILFDSGFATRLPSFRLAVAPAVVLSSFGVMLTSALLAVPAHFILGVDWLTALLLGAIVGSTDAAAVFFLLRIGGIQIRERVRAVLEIESGSNDPMAILLTLTVVELIRAGASNAYDLTWGFLTSFATQIGLGFAFGIMAGYLMAKLFNSLRFEPGLYPVAILGLALCLFAFTSVLGGSGFLAVYIAGLIMGNMRFRGGLPFRRFQEGATWLAQITIFLVLGLLATPSTFPVIAWQAVAIGLALIFVVRPLAVWLCLLPFGFSRNETTFIAWVGLRGAVSILLAILPIIGHVPGGQMLFNVTFIIVLTSLLIQGWAIRPMARWLGLIVPPQIGPVDKVELELPGNARHELVVYRVAADSPVVKGERIPHWARPSLIVRKGRSMRLHDAGRPQPRDYVYIFAVPRFIPLLDRLFASPADDAARSAEYLGDFTLDPNCTLGSLANTYGFEIPPEDAETTVEAYISKRLGTPLGRGDRLLLGPVELIVREVQEPSGKLSIGLALEPTPASVPKLPVFQSYQEIVAGLRRRLARGPAWGRRADKASAKKSPSSEATEETPGPR